MPNLNLNSAHSFIQKLKSRHAVFIALILCLAGFLTPSNIEAAGAWTPLVNQAPGSIHQMFLLTDGTVICQNSDRN